MPNKDRQVLRSPGHFLGVTVAIARSFKTKICRTVSGTDDYLFAGSYFVRKGRYSEAVLCFAVQPNTEARSQLTIRQRFLLLRG